LTLSRSLLVKNRLTEAITRSRRDGCEHRCCIVGVPAKAVIASGQFLVAVVKHEIA
jgi:hypothetical protein